MEVSNSSENAASRSPFTGTSDDNNSFQANTIPRSWSSSVRPNDSYNLSAFDFGVQSGDETWNGLFRSPSRGYGVESPFSYFINHDFSTPLISSPSLSSFGLDAGKSHVSHFNEITRLKIQQAVLVSRVGFNFLSTNISNYLAKPV
jgi:hypothetical protein